jgi:hypothetical protein
MVIAKEMVARREDLGIKDEGPALSVHTRLAATLVGRPRSGIKEVHR